MKTNLPLHSMSLLKIACAGLMLASVPPASAADLTWDPNVSGGSNLGGDGTWNTSNTNWWNGTSDVVFATGDSVTFTGTGGGSAPHAVSVTTGLNFLNLNVTSNDYEITSTSGEFAMNNTGTLSIASGVTGTVINVTGGYFRLNASSGGTVYFSNTDLADFGTTMFGFSDNGRTLSVTNSTSSGVTVLPKLAVTRTNSVTYGSTITGSGNVTINSLGGRVVGNSFGTLTNTDNPALYYTGTGIITVNGNNTSFENTGTGTLSFNLNNASATLRIGNDNAFGARDAGNALTDSGLILTAGTVEASGGARNIENRVTLAGNTTVAGSNAITFAGAFTNSGGNRTLTVNNSALTTLSGNVYLAESDTSRTMTVAGTGNTTISGVITNNSGANSAASGLTKAGSGTLTLSNDNTYTGATTVNAGTLLIAAGGSITSNASVASGAAIGGDGTITGSLSLASSGKFVFSATETLSVTGSVSLDTTFGIDDLLGIDGSTAVGTYTLIDTTATDFSSLGIENWGVANAYDLGGGKSAYFQQGSLQVVVIPEPATVVMLIGGVGMLIGFRRGRRS